jgi:type IV pilus assembly protein PilB
MGYPMERFYKGVGCRKCRNTGYSGRIGVHEILVVNDELRDSIVASASIADIRRLGIAGGMVTMRHDGFRKVREGLTTVEEVIQISGDFGSLLDKRVAAAPAEESLAAAAN